MCFATQQCVLFRCRNFEKWSECEVLLAFFTSKCASQHNSVYFFRHRNFQKWSENGVLCAFSLGNVLRATTAHDSARFFDISTSNLNFQKWSECEMLLADHMAPHPPRAYFSTLRSHKSLENTVNPDFPTFSRSCVFFLVSLSLP